MATILFANNAATTLAGPLTSTATTLNVAAGTGVLFPQPGTGQYFCLTLTDAATGLLNEILYVTAVNGDTLTIQRGQENTAPQSWLAGDLADNLITAGSLTAFAQSTSITSGTYQGTDTGTSPNAVIVASTTPSISAPVQGQYFQIVKSGSSNTGPVTCRIGSGGSAAGVLYKDGSALSAADWPANAAAILYFNGGVFQFVACAAPSPAQTTYGATEGVKNVSGTFSLDYPDLTAENTLNDADLLAFYASEAEGGQPSGHHYKVTANALSSYVLSSLRGATPIASYVAYIPLLSSQTIYLDPNCYAFDVPDFRGGGGGGGNANGGVGAGGGGAGFCCGRYASPVDRILNVTIGAGGAAQGKGGDSIIADSAGNVICRANGGNGASGNTPGTGGTASGGQVNISGTAGTTGLAIGGSYYTGTGGPAFLTGYGLPSGLGQTTTAQANGQIGGVGGGGGGNSAGQSGANGGSGIGRIAQIIGR